MRPGNRNSLTDVAGVLVGHHYVRDDDATLGSGAATGSTVVRVPGGAVAAVDVRGGGPGTRETDLLDPSNTVQQVNAILLSGGSAYGLAAADGIMAWLEEQGEGIPMDEDGHVVPIVPGAVIFDLPVGDWQTRPTAEFGYRAVEAAGEQFETGSVGAGVGARAGTLKGGVGTASVLTADGFTVGALVVANPVGSVFDPHTGLTWGDPRFFGLREADPDQLAAANALDPKGTPLNTTIGVVATDARLSSNGCKRMAMAAHDGLARAIRPAHSPLDGDTMFALATGTAASTAEYPPMPAAFRDELPIVDSVCAAAAIAVERAIADAVLAATSVAGIPTYRELLSSVFRPEEG
ncbi:P1 family peptidase [Antrihabitans stalactiti]|uniref:P1 family peptidase n=1 Tax=Antrihabitans stalactiti TaxID=2584121 RepID=A0A848KRE3_9NOCA|nr:P1 family peptidase [Antrihabitans stalactiti]